MSPSRGEKRKRSPSPSKSKSPEVKKGGKLGGLLSFLTPKKKETPSKKKRLSFGAPVNYEFDTCSPSCRPRPFLDNATLDAQLMERGQLAPIAPALFVWGLRSRGPSRVCLQRAPVRRRSHGTEAHAAEY